MKHRVQWMVQAAVALVLVLGLLPLRAAFAQESIRDKKDIVDTAIAAGDFTTLVQAVDAAGLVETLKGEGPFTVFAPTDEAFAALPAGTLESLLADPAALQQVLTYHVLPGRVIAAMINDGGEKATVQGETVKFSVVDRQKLVNDAKIVVKNVLASNGIIHVIDKVILPPSMSGVTAPAAAADAPAADATTAAEAPAADATAAAPAADAMPGEVPTLAGEVFAEGFNGPMGVLVDPNGDVWVIDSGIGGDEAVEGLDFSGQPMTGAMGMTARVVKVSAADGSQTDVAMLPSLVSGTETEGGSRLALLNGKLYATGAGWHPGLIPATAEEPLPLTGGVMEIGEDGTVTQVADLWEIEKAKNPAGGELDNHPYGLGISPDGSALLIADAGSNALYRFDPADGSTSVVGVFEPIEGVFPNPNYDNQLLRDAVSTGVAVKDGEIYVGYLTGAPFIPGTAKVVKVDADGAVTDYATGLTMLTDLRAGPDGNLYATQFGVFGEQGPVPNSGAVVRILEGAGSEVVVANLSLPTSIDFSPEGDAYVTINGAGAPGSGQVVKFAGLTALPGVPVGAALAAMAPPPAPAEAEAMATETMTDTMAGEAMATETMTDTAGYAGTGAGAEGAAAVSASDQDSDGSSVTVASVTAAVDGWMVIHADADGKPGPVLGHTAVPAGTTENVVVMLDPALTADAKLWAMLHIDEGALGTYEFPGPDAPVKDGDKIVMTPFMATVTAPAEAATEAPVADATEAPAPESMPATGSESNNLLLLAVVGFVLLGMGGLAVVSRRRTA